MGTALSTQSVDYALRLITRWETDKPMRNDPVSESELQRLRKVIRERHIKGRIAFSGNITIVFGAGASRDQLKAFSQVFNIEELLEHILMYLDPNDILLRAQLVCKGFRRSIHSSVLLRQKLFLSPDHKRRNVAFLPFSIFQDGWMGSKARGESHMGSRDLRRFQCSINSLFEVWDQMKHCAELDNFLLIQPPIQNAIVHICDVECGVRLRVLQKDVVCSREIGLSVGDVIRAASQLHDEHGLEYDPDDDSIDPWWTIVIFSKDDNEDRRAIC